jgi:hypothetical protein
LSRFFSDLRELTTFMPLSLGKGRKIGSEPAKSNPASGSPVCAACDLPISCKAASTTVCYNDPELATFWWGQAEKLAAIVKQAAPVKLVGMATHDDPKIPGKAAAYMASCPHIDFWGVNTYQTKTFDPVFNSVPNVGPGYSGLSGPALKPVILTEYGLPATGHRNTADPSTIYDDATTRAATAAVVGAMVPQAFQYPICLGPYYFEFCDEWWNEPLSPNIYTWWGGVPDAGFPNGFWDQDGFGLYSIARGGDLPNNAPIWVGNGPNPSIDVHSERTELTAGLRQAFAAAKYRHSLTQITPITWIGSVDMLVREPACAYLII